MISGHFPVMGKFWRLVFMETRVEKSESIGELMAALCKAQASMGGASKSAVNPFFKSKYADLTEVRKVAMVIHEFGLSITQFPCGDNGLVTILGHESGQYISCEMNMKPVKSDPQGIGSCLTYMRRYSMQSVLGIPAADDDANEASKPQGHTGFTNTQKSMIQKLLKENEPDWVRAAGTPSKWNNEVWNKAADLARKHKKG